MERILIIEDEKDVNRLLAQTLQDNGYETFSVYNGLDAVKILEEGQFQMVLLDLMLPYKSGDEVLKDIRKTSDIPVIVISAKDMVRTKVDLLAAGADDYITKPFSLMALRARVENIRKRALRQPGQIYEEAGYRFDFEKLDFRVNGIETSLSASEQKLLRLFVTHPGQTLPRGMLLESIWSDGMDYVDENALSVTVSRLRRKLEIKDRQSPISTVYGIGYVWKYMEEGK